MGAQGVHGDLLADEVPGRPDGAVFLHVVAVERLAVLAVVVDDGLDRRSCLHQLHDRAGEIP
jgi:hypothetical protein